MNSKSCLNLMTCMSIQAVLSTQIDEYRCRSTEILLSSCRLPESDLDISEQYFHVTHVAKTMDICSGPMSYVTLPAH